MACDTNFRCIFMRKSETTGYTVRILRAAVMAIFERCPYSGLAGEKPGKVSGSFYAATLSVF